MAKLGLAWLRLKRWELVLEVSVEDGGEEGPPLTDLEGPWAVHCGQAAREPLTWDLVGCV